MIRKRKSFSRPKRPFEKDRIEEEKQIKKEFGLKNKKEIWKTDAKIKSIRTRAKKLIPESNEKQQALFDQLKKIGLEVNSIADVLSLEKKDLLNRRLQTVIVNKELCKTIKEARQLITHRKVLVDGRAINSPSYIVPVELESKITLKRKKKKLKSEKAEEVVGEKLEVAEETSEEKNE